MYNLCVNDLICVFLSLYICGRHSFFFLLSVFIYYQLIFQQYSSSLGLQCSECICKKFKWKNLLFLIIICFLSVKNIYVYTYIYINIYMHFGCCFTVWFIMYKRKELFAIVGKDLVQVSHLKVYFYRDMGNHIFFFSSLSVRFFCG